MTRFLVALATLALVALLGTVMTVCTVMAAPLAWGHHQCRRLIDSLLVWMT